VCEHLIREGKFKVCGLTRDTNGQVAVELRNLGVHIIQGDLNNVDSLRSAFKDVQLAFLMTDFWEANRDSELEYKQGKNFVDVAKEFNIKLLVYSSGEDAKKLTNGRVRVAMWEGKVRVMQYIKSINVPCTELLPSFFMENFLDKMPPRRSSDGRSWEFHIPFEANHNVELLAARDIGGVVNKLFLNPNQYINQSIPLVGEVLTAERMIDTFSRAVGEPAKLVTLSIDQFRNSGIKLAEDFAELAQFCKEYSGKKDARLARSIYPQMHTWEQWLKEIWVHQKDKLGKQQPYKAGGIPISAEEQKRREQVAATSQPGAPHQSK
jgi:uncharacterized protein YbjT (DUF2867 family)